MKIGHWGTGRRSTVCLSVGKQDSCLPRDHWLGRRHVSICNDHLGKHHLSIESHKLGSSRDRLRRVLRFN